MKVPRQVGPSATHIAKKDVRNCPRLLNMQIDLNNLKDVNELFAALQIKLSRGVDWSITAARHHGVPLYLEAIVQIKP